MLNYIINWFSTLGNIGPVMLNKIVNNNYDKKRESYYKMYSIYSPISFMSDCNFIIDNIYLGSSYNASNKLLLEYYEIKSIVNATANIPNFFENEIDYFNININDNGEDIFTKENLENSYNFICSQPTNVLVHCVFGRSRSATIVLYYLIRKYKYTIEEALLFLKNKRYYINPSITFINNLKNIIN
tara:strand:- start:171 stop:728 length:558 start_codon:yes stop_codon:yes gene_type:complete